MKNLSLMTQPHYAKNEKNLSSLIFYYLFNHVVLYCNTIHCKNSPNFKNRFEKFLKRKQFSCWNTHTFIYYVNVNISWELSVSTVERKDWSVCWVPTEMSPMWTNSKNAHNALHQHPFRGLWWLPVSLG